MSTFAFFLLLFPINTLNLLLVTAGFSFEGLYGSEIYTNSLVVLVEIVILLCTYIYRKRIHLFEFSFSGVEILSAFFVYGLTLSLQIFFDPSQGFLDARIYTSVSGRVLITFLALSVLLVNILLLVTLWKNKTSFYYRQMDAQNHQYIEAELKYFQMYQCTQNDLRKFRHDIKHHIQYMNQLCNQHDFQGVETYIDELEDNWGKADKLFYTGNNVVDSIINAKVYFMKKENIVFSLSGAFINKLSLPPFDLCTIFSNALDNAIEENSRNKGERYISVSIRQSNNYYLIIIENPFHSGKTWLKSTSKSDKINHGFGLYSIKEKTEKNGGYISIDTGNNTFKLEIFLPIEAAVYISHRKDDL